MASSSMSHCRHPSSSLWRDVPSSVNSSAVVVVLLAPWEEQQKKLLVGLNSRRPSAIINSSAAIALSRNFDMGTYFDRPLSSLGGGSFSCACALAAVGTKDSPPLPAAHFGDKEEVEEEEEAKDEEKEDEDDWESEIFQGFKDMRQDGRYRKSGNVEEEANESKVSKLKEEKEKMVDWSAKARERAVKAIQARDLPTAKVLGDDQEEKKKKRMRRKRKKKKLAAAAAAAESRMAKGALEETTPMTAAGRAPDEKHLPGDLNRMDRIREIPPHLMKSSGSGEGLQEQLSGMANYWRSLGNAAAATGGAAADDTATRLENGAKDFTARVVSSATRKASSISGRGGGGGGPRGHLVTSRQKRQEDFELNRKLVGAAGATEVLTLVGGVLENGGGAGGESDCPLSPFNVSTSLHRIAKHMESTSMSKSERLAFARRRVMAQLVSAAMESLPNCSAQSVSNIAWALSKVGGYSLYGPEMDRLADVAVSKISELEPQHVANIAGALASMQHSVPALFRVLERRAASHHRYFRSQELAQLLWAFATLNQPATLLLDALDFECRNDPSILTPPSASASASVIEEASVSSSPVLADGHVPFADHTKHIDSFLRHGEPENSDSDSERRNAREEGRFELGADAPLERSNAGRRGEEEVPGSLLLLGEESGPENLLWVSGEKYFDSSSLSQLASLSWSYTVLGQLERPSFALIWNAISKHGKSAIFRVSDLPCPRLQLSQLHQTKLSLQLEFPALNLNLSLGQPLESLARKEWESIKSGLKSTSVAQLDVERLLAGMGQRWVAEYTALDYSVDAALVDRKIGLEIDGPSHFARNTGAPLGHTVLKRRHLAAAGWTIIPIPYQEWDEQVGEKEQTRYVYDLLKHHL